MTVQERSEETAELVSASGSASPKANGGTRPLPPTFAADEMITRFVRNINRRRQTAERAGPWVGSGSCSYRCAVGSVRVTVMRVSLACALQVFLRVLVKGHLAAFGAEIVRLALVFTGGRRRLGVDLHVTDNIQCHLCPLSIRVRSSIVPLLSVGEE